MENELGQINYRTNALMTQASRGNDSVNCGKYVMMYILFIANIERDNSQESDFVMVSHDNLSSMSNLQKLRDVRDILFTRFQEMMDLDNQANIRKEELILSVSSLSSEDEFEVLDFNSDSSENDSEFSIENIRQNLDQLERFNLIALREIAKDINQIFNSRINNLSYVDKVKNSARGSGGVGK
ncbi:uncharacterized protein TRIADDRAFT_62960 [Trichoplax adhaerens]|uniref:Uncharacterized protein n=1 Tax=Trichoplax adhaerens TaxID=10228 RepID=B3SFG7_TRIAD|nr:predicted protein [Trichoplax adhaerens]EDV18527.1 predicted protein [Trichoplax adhaerens]|eukprot:XP_002118986.1 predicted protein [Trichoplax adhaerens]